MLLFYDFSKRNERATKQKLQRWSKKSHSFEYLLASKQIDDGYQCASAFVQTAKHYKFAIESCAIAMCIVYLHSANDSWLSFLEISFWLFSFSARWLFIYFHKFSTNFPSIVIYIGFGYFHSIFIIFLFVISFHLNRFLIATLNETCRNAFSDMKVFKIKKKMDSSCNRSHTVCPLHFNRYVAVAAQIM